MVCSVCGQALAPDSLFCENCGSPVAAAPAGGGYAPAYGGQRLCPNCNSLWESDVMFCAECGTATVEYSDPGYAPAAPATPEYNAPVVQRICTGCNTVWDGDIAFCAECGAPTAPYGTGAVPAAPTCPNCGAVIEAGSDFCGNCGYNLAGLAVGAPMLAAGLKSTTPATPKPPADPVGQAFLHNPTDDDL